MSAPSSRRCLVAVLAALTMLSVACIPSERGPARELGDGSDPVPRERPLPEFPDSGVVPPEVLVDALVIDFTDRPADLTYWTPPEAEARCAAEAIVDGVGAERLSELGYRPRLPGSSLNDLALDDDERSTVVDAMGECVDMTEAIAQIVFGDGRVVPEVANCFADGLAEAQVLDLFVEAIAFGEPVDPFAADAGLAAALLGQANVCVPEQGFDWPDLRLPDDRTILDQDAAPGAAGSPFADDQATTTTRP